jgi:hypothetical protein
MHRVVDYRDLAGDAICEEKIGERSKGKGERDRPSIEE